MSVELINNLTPKSPIYKWAIIYDQLREQASLVLFHRVNDSCHFNPNIQTLIKLSESRYAIPVGCTVKLATPAYYRGYEGSEVGVHAPMEGTFSY